MYWQLRRLETCVFRFGNECRSAQQYLRKKVPQHSAGPNYSSRQEQQQKTAAEIIIRLVDDYFSGQLVSYMACAGEFETNLILWASQWAHEQSVILPKVDGPGQMSWWRVRAIQLNVDQALKELLNLIQSKLVPWM